MPISNEDILRYTETMYGGSIFKPWLSERDAVSIDSLRKKCNEWLITNYSTRVKPDSKLMTKIVYTLITRFLGTDLYWKFSSGARNGEQEHSLLRNHTVRAVAPAPSAPMPWDGGPLPKEIPPSAPPIHTSAKLGSMYPNNPCNEVSMSGKFISSLGDAPAPSFYMTTTPTTKGTTMNRVFEKKSFVNGRDTDGMTDIELLAAIRTCKAGIEDLEDTDVVSKYTLKQIAYYEKAIKRIINVLDKRV